MLDWFKCCFRGSSAGNKEELSLLGMENRQIHTIECLESDTFYVFFLTLYSTTLDLKCPESYNLSR